MAKKHSQAGKKEQQKPAAAKPFSFSGHPLPVIVFLFSFLLYSNTLHHGFVMDDGAVITNHETVKKGFSGIKELFGQSSVYGSTKENFGTYRPLTMSLFAVEYELFGDSPASYHFIQVLLYSILCVVLFIALKKLLKNYPPLLPAAAALLFIAHPIHTEVTANIKSADEILSLLFCALALLFAINFSETSEKKQAGISFLFFLCALFTKESAATFLFIIPLALHFFSDAKRRTIFTVACLHLSAILIYLLVRNAALDKAPEGIAIINNTLAGATGSSERYATAFVILLHYLKLLFFPHPLCWDYGYNQIPLVGFGDPVAVISLLVYLALGIFSFTILIRPAICKSANLQICKLTSFCILFYLISLSVSSNLFVLIGATMAERFLFAPSLGFCILLAFGLIKLLKAESLNIKPLTFHVKLTPFLIILILFSVKTWSRNKDWRSNLDLFAKGVEDSPNSYRANTTYAWESVLAGEKEKDKAKKKMHLQTSVEYYQKGLAIYDKVDADWYNYGVSNSNLGKADEAVKCYQRALEINPNHRNSLYNLATVYMSRKDYQNALTYFLRAYEIEPDFMDIAFKVGLLYQMSGNPKEAIPYYERYLQNNPNNKDVLNNLMLACKALGDFEKMSYYQKRLNNIRK